MLEPDLIPEDALKERTVKVHFHHAGGETKKVSEEEAKKIMNEIYNSTYGGLIVDLKTNRVIYQINSDVEEILVLEGVAAGG